MDPKIGAEVYNSSPHSQLKEFLFKLGNNSQFTIPLTFRFAEK